MIASGVRATPSSLCRASIRRPSGHPFAVLCGSNRSCRAPSSSPRSCLPRRCSRRIRHAFYNLPASRSPCLGLHPGDSPWLRHRAIHRHRASDRGGRHRTLLKRTSATPRPPALNCWPRGTSTSSPRPWPKSSPAAWKTPPSALANTPASSAPQKQNHSCLPPPTPSPSPQILNSPRLLTFFVLRGSRPRHLSSDRSLPSEPPR